MGALPGVGYPCIGGPLAGRIYSAPVMSSAFTIELLPELHPAVPVNPDAPVSIRSGVYRLQYCRGGLAWVFQA